jgi:hypothetical protein
VRTEQPRRKLPDCLRMGPRCKSGCGRIVEQNGGICESNICSRQALRDQARPFNDRRQSTDVRDAKTKLGKNVKHIKILKIEKTVSNAHILKM